MIKKMKFVADFETTNYEGQETSEVWASAITALGNIDKNLVFVDNSLEKFLERVFLLPYHSDIYFHNLKWDGYFILDWLKRNPEWKEWGTIDSLNNKKPTSKMPNNHYTYTISADGVWYRLVLKFKNKVFNFLDSYKVLPFSVSKIGKDFKTTYQKTEIEYKGFRESGGEITPEEIDYIKNDVLVISEALDIIQRQGLTKGTIGSNCLGEFLKTRYGLNKTKDLYRAEFPELAEDLFIRKSYKGGWCYVHKKDQLVLNGITLDVNSLYPSMMHSASGNLYPYGTGTYFEGNPEDLSDDLYYFIKIRATFDLKEGFFPTIQIKGNVLYKPTEWITTSDFIAKDGKKYDYYIDENGYEKKIYCELTLTKTDYLLFKEHYDIHSIEFFGGYYYQTKSGIFDEYIDMWMEVKKTSTGAMRTIAKLMLNNLYGKFASSDDSSYLMYELNEKGTLSSKIVESNEKEMGYIPIGSAITSYARNFTIRHAQKNYKDFCYADTDSLHLTTDILNVVDIDLHDSNLLCWAHESTWEEAIFAGQKRYIEKDLKDGYIIRCAGMGKTAKENVLALLNQGKIKLTDFKTGFEVEGNLKSRNIKGGRILEDFNYKMR